MYKSYTDTVLSGAETATINSRILGKLYDRVSTLYGKNLHQRGSKFDNLSIEYTNLQYLKGGIYDFNEMKKYDIRGKECTLDVDFVIPSMQSKDKLVAIKEVLNGYLLIQIGGETEVTYNKWMVDFGMATAIPESVSRKPTFDYRG